MRGACTSAIWGQWSVGYAAYWASPGRRSAVASRCASDETALRTDVARLASRFGRYGYRRVTELLRTEGWEVNHKRVERIWRQEGLKVPRRQPKRGRLWLNDGSCIRLPPNEPESRLVL